MSILEQRITKNKELFDVNEPEEGHFKRFQEKLQKIQPEVKRSYRRLYVGAMKIAASVIILLAVTFMLFIYNNGSKNLFATEASPELLEAVDYYSTMNEQKLAKIDELSKADAESEKLKENALANANAIAMETKKLEQEYIASNKDARVLGAIVSNYRFLTSVLDKVIDNMNEVQERKLGVL